MRDQLALRRELLAEAWKRRSVEVRFSEGVVGQGRALYASAMAAG